jgi:ATP-dependent exoDNAse (exonuclease V) alpha subunit
VKKEIDIFIEESTIILMIGPKNTDAYSDFLKSPNSALLNENQLKFVRSFFQGKNIFLGGSAGTGKSFVIKTLFDYLQTNRKSVAKTSTTGISAFNIGGVTIYSFMGIGLGEEDTKTLISKVAKNKKAKDRILNAKTILIDECSMLKASLLEKIVGIFRYYRHNKLPQFIFVGDFLQLQPIWKNDETKEYCFNSEEWDKLEIEPIILKKIIRQDNSSEFASLLNRIRIGDTSDLSLLEKAIDRKFPDDGIHPIRVFCKNIDVNKYNAEKLAQIPTPLKVYKSKDSGLPHHIESFDKNCNAPKILELKVGAQVMLLRNIDTEGGFVNGSIGVVTGYSTEGVVVKFINGKKNVSEETWEIKEQEATVTGEIKYKVVATRTQIPLKIAFASSVHKTQGLTIDRAVVDMNGAFTSGQVYTALSRVRDIDSLSLVDFPTSRIWVDRESINFYKKIGALE